MPFPDAKYPHDQRLIAAAPSLLVALRELKDEAISLYEEVYADDESDNQTTDAIDFAIEVLAIAEGRGA